MARTISQIQDEILVAKAGEPALTALTSTSKVAVWRIWTFITATVIWTLEKLFDIHKAEVQELIANLRPGTPLWYRNKALDFQYGFALLPDSDLFDNTAATQEQIDASKIIKFSAVTEAETESRVIIKIATEEGGKLAPIAIDRQAVFEAYIAEIKYAGVAVTVINFLPDILKLQIRIFRDPLLIDENGTDRLSGGKPVEAALLEYMRELPFNGELVIQDLANKLEAVSGVEIVQVDSIESKWIEVESGGYGPFQPIDVRKIPVSGYFEIENFENITYVV
ncbi:MAG: nucleotidyltransferase [Flavobacteriaceae bacterium]|nr:nucleotidyltransferase [Flavobacteriaceae bacterium]